ncbi:hypothetical protein KAI87_02660 [Myxococcota bacterium]|nr:hypothetical protein [Myxococcota bacterium]
MRTHKQFRWMTLGAAVLALSACGDDGGGDDQDSSSLPDAPILSSVSAFGTTLELNFSTNAIDGFYEIYVHTASFDAEELAQSNFHQFTNTEARFEGLALDPGYWDQEAFIRSRFFSNSKHEYSELSNELSIKIFAPVPVTSVESTGPEVSVSWDAQAGVSYRIVYSSSPFSGTLEGVQQSALFTSSPATVDVSNECGASCAVALIAEDDNSTSVPAETIPGHIVQTAPSANPSTSKRVENDELVFDLLQADSATDSILVWAGTDPSVSPETGIAARVSQINIGSNLYTAHIPLSRTTGDDGELLTYYYIAQSSSTFSYNGVEWVTKSPLPTGYSGEISLDFPLFILHEESGQAVGILGIENLQRHGDTLYWTVGGGTNSPLYSYPVDGTSDPTSRTYMHDHAQGLHILVDSDDDTKVYYGVDSPTSSASSIFLTIGGNTFEAQPQTSETDPVQYLTQDATHIYGHSVKRVFRIDKSDFSNAGTEILAECAGTVTSMTLNATSAYFSCKQDPDYSIWSVSKTGGDAAELTTLYGAAAMAWDETNARLIFADSDLYAVGGIYSVDPTAGSAFDAPTVLVSKTSDVKKLQVHNDVLYFYGSTGVRSIPLSGGVIREWFNFGDEFLVSHVGDTDYLYTNVSGYGLARYPIDYGHNLAPFEVDITILDVTARDADVSLYWNSLPGAIAYEIYVDGASEPSRVLGWNSTVMQAPNGVEQSYTVKAVSEDLQTTTTGMTVSATPKLTNIGIQHLYHDINGSQEVAVIWNNPYIRDSLALKMWRLDHGTAFDPESQSPTVEFVMDSAANNSQVGTRYHTFTTGDTGLTLDASDIGKLYDYHFELKDGDNGISYLTETFMPKEILNTSSSPYITGNGPTAGNHVAFDGSTIYYKGSDNKLYSGLASAITEDANHDVNNNYKAITSDGTHVVWAGYDSYGYGLFEVGTGSWMDANPRTYGDLAFVGSGLWAATNTTANRLELYQLDFASNDNDPVATHAYGTAGAYGLTGYEGTLYFIQGTSGAAAIYQLSSGDSAATLVAEVANAVDIATDGISIFVRTYARTLHKVDIQSGTVEALGALCLTSDIVVTHENVGNGVEPFLYACFKHDTYVQQFGRISTAATLATEGSFADALDPADVTTFWAGPVVIDGLWYGDAGLWLTSTGSQLYHFAGE